MAKKRSLDNADSAVRPMIMRRSESSVNRDTDKEVSIEAFRKLIHRMDGNDRDKEVLVSIMERMIEHERGIPGNALLLALPYCEYLKTAHWQKTRSAALRDADNRCSLCNAGGELHCHHRTYSRIGYEGRNDVICLCKECHKIFHENRTAEMQRCTAST